MSVRLAFAFVALWYAAMAQAQQATDQPPAAASEVTPQAGQQPPAPMSEGMGHGPRESGMEQMLAGMQEMLRGMQQMMHRMSQMERMMHHRMEMMHGMDGREGAPPRAGRDHPQAGEAAPSTDAYRAAMAKMHEGMDIEYSGNADADFVEGMIPHHAGAVDMAKVELEYGHDPELRRLAQAIVEAQEREIETMQDWLDQHKP
jgi:uncharacterized protein (DUF305 family)